VKISARNFGRDRRYPIVNRFREELGAPPSDAGKATGDHGVASRTGAKRPSST
jgi:hypothetical protein